LLGNPGGQGGWRVDADRLIKIAWDRGLDEGEPVFPDEVEALCANVATHISNKVYRAEVLSRVCLTCVVATPTTADERQGSAVLIMAALSALYELEETDEDIVAGAAGALMYIMGVGYADVDYDPEEQFSAGLLSLLTTGDELASALLRKALEYASTRTIGDSSPDLPLPVRAARDGRCAYIRSVLALHDLVPRDPSPVLVASLDQPDWPVDDDRYDPDDVGPYVAFPWRPLSPDYYLDKLALAADNIRPSGHGWIELQDLRAVMLMTAAFATGGRLALHSFMTKVVRMDTCYDEVAEEVTSAWWQAARIIYGVAPALLKWLDDTREWPEGDAVPLPPCGKALIAGGDAVAAAHMRGVLRYCIRARGEAYGVDEKSEPHLRYLEALVAA
jgi:hypothetical protein